MDGYAGAPERTLVSMRTIPAAVLADSQPPVTPTPGGHQIPGLHWHWDLHAMYPLPTIHKIKNKINLNLEKNYR